MLPSSLLSQRSYRLQGKSIFELRREKEQERISIPIPALVPPVLLLPLSRALPAFAGDPYTAPGQMPTAYSYERLGIFCKFEVQMERATRFPIKFRLGEVQYTEGLEGKDRWSEPGKPKNK